MPSALFMDGRQRCFIGLDVFYGARHTSLCFVLTVQLNVESWMMIPAFASVYLALQQSRITLFARIMALRCSDEIKHFMLFAALFIVWLSL